MTPISRVCVARARALSVTRAERNRFEPTITASSTADSSVKRSRIDSRAMVMPNTPSARPRRRRRLAVEGDADHPAQIAECAAFLGIAGDVERALGFAVAGETTLAVIFRHEHTVCLAARVARPRRPVPFPSGHDGAARRVSIIRRSHASGRALRLRTRETGAVTLISASRPAISRNCSVTRRPNTAGTNPLNPTPCSLITLLVVGHHLADGLHLRLQQPAIRGSANRLVGGIQIGCLGEVREGELEDAHPGRAPCRQAWDR